MAGESMATTNIYATSGGMSALSALAMLSTALGSLHRLRKAQMKKLVINPGDEYELLTIVKEVERHQQPNGKFRRMVLCRCKCGTETVTQLHSLTSGHTTSCGCFGKTTGRGNATHGRCGTPVYRAWQDMIQRCYNPLRPRYVTYGARGITVCKRWRESFEAFLEDMGDTPSPRHSIDRIENDQGYCKANCRWATKKQQSRNTSRNVVLTYQDKAMCVAEWAEEIGIPYATLYGRIVSGWTIKDALTKPVRRW